MQVFEVIALDESPYMEALEVIEGNFVKDIISEDKVFILIDHDSKRIWTYNGKKSSLKLQIYGGIIARLFRKQLRLFYRIFFLNEYDKNSDIFKEVMEKPLSGGRAKAIKKDDIPLPSNPEVDDRELCVHEGLNINRAIKIIGELPKIEGFHRRFMIIGANIYTDEELVEKFIQEEKKVINQVKLGQLNRGFTFFGDANYSTRLIIKEGKVQGLELYVSDKEESASKVLDLKIPIFYEERFRKKGSIETLIKAFQIPDELPDIKNGGEAPINGQD
ncbi:MAG: hypothetical protein ACTSQP_03695 [Promethearchaeota archaeon]